ncbi:MAG: hypothetical protein R3D59_01495 [Paracoccaceae bacterium]|nr:hypothetical protein [Maritimibacter sp.]
MTVNPDHNNPSGSTDLAWRRPSWLFTRLFDRLNDMGATYCVMNNYEDMPGVIPTDVDIAIDPVSFAGLDDFLSEFAAANGGSIAQKLWHGHRKCAFVICVGDPRARAYLHLDFFVDASTNGFPLVIPNADLVAGRLKLHNFYIPRPEIELVFIVGRRLYKGDWTTGHCARIAALYKRIDGSDWLAARYRWMRDIIALALAGDASALRARQPGDYRSLRRLAWKSAGAGGRWRYRIGQLRRSLFRLRFETGTAVVVISRDGLGEALTQELKIEMAPMFFRTVFHSAPPRSAAAVLRDLLHLKILKSSKAGIVYDLSEGDVDLAYHCARLARLGLIDGICAVQGVSVPTRLRHCGAHDVSDIVDVAEMMLAVQTTKTQRALGHAGSQTAAGGKPRAGNA